MTKYFREYKLAEPLQNYIECVWFEDFTQLEENSGRTHLVVPDNTVELVLTNNSFERSSNEKKIKIRSHLTGLKTKPQQVKVVGKPLLSIRFKPHGIYPFINENVIDTVNESINAELLFGKRIIQIQEQITSKNSEFEKVQLLEEFFSVRLLELNKKSDPFFNYLLQKINHSKGQTHLRKISKELQVSQKTIQRKFLKYMGITPKKYSRLVRLIEVLKYHEKQSSLNFSNQLYNFGYFDQMHFLKEVKDFTGKTPTEYFSQDRGLQKAVFNC
tara:strand:+ start:27237 stop:28052 length:816 start_codon:yes stop_codon:yes gene_type:complete